jgi:ankyrin repeat protein
MPKRYFNGVFTQELFSAWQELVPVEPTSHLICTESLLEVISQLQDYIPERYDGEMAAVCDQLISSSTDRVFLSFLGYAVYLSTNNLLGSYQINAMLSLVLQSKYFHTMVSFLNSELPTIEAFSQKLLQAALHSCDKAAIEALLGACVDLALVGYSFGAEFQAAVRNNEFEVVQLLLRNGLDVNIKLPPMPELWTQNILASVSTLRIMQVLVEAGAYVNQPGFYLLPDSHFHWKTPLQHTSSVGDINRVRFLLQAGAEVNAPAFPRNVSPDKSVPGVTALMAAVEGNHLEVVELLLQSGADINQYSSFADCAKYQYMTNPYQSHYLLSFEADKEGHVEGTVLQIAAKSGNLELVQLLVKFGAHVDKRNQWKQHDRRPSRSNDLIFRKTALAEAAENGHYEVVELLLHAGADVNAEVLSKFGERIIHATNHHSRMRRLLLQSGAVEHAPSCIDLQLAVWRGDLERAEKLLSIGLDPDIRALGETDLGGCLMHMAVLRGHKTLVKLLLGKGARMDHPASLTTCLQAATLLNDFETVEVLCHAGADVNAITSATPCPPLQLCPLYEKDNDSNRDIFRCLLHCGANVKIPAVPSKQYGTPLQNVMAMAGRCDYDIVQELLSSGADVNARGAPFTALQQAIKRADPGDDYRIIRILLEAGADINQRLQANGTMGTTPFQMAIGMRHTHLDFEFEQFENHMKLVEFLLKSGADINAEAGLEIFTGSEARTALQEAADGEDADENLANQDSKLIQFLLKHGADVNAPPSRWRGRTALQAAAARQYCSIKIVQVLLEAGADVNGPACPSYGITALQGAAIQGHIKIAKMLLEAGAKVNAPGSKKEGRTALEGAAERGRLDMVQLLLNAGADTHLPIEKRYRSAAEFAKERHHFAIAKLLMSYAEG